jgi:hypothetical protein
MNRTTVIYSSLILLLGSRMAIWAQQAPSRSPAAVDLAPDLAMVPADTIQLISFNLGQPWNGPEAASLKRISSVHPVMPTWALREIQANVGVEPDNIERMIQLSTPTRPVSFIRTRMPYDREKVLAAFVPAAVQKSAGDKQYFSSGQNTNSLFALDERTLILGVGQDLATFLSSQAPPQRDASLDYALKKIQSGAPVVVHAGPRVVASFAADLRLSDGPYAALAKAHCWQIIAELENGLTVKLIADFASKEEAANSVDAFKLIGAKLTDLMPFMKTNMIPFLQGQEREFPGSSELATRMSTAIDRAAEALKAIDVRAVNNRAGAQIQIKTDEPLTTAVLLLTLTPRAGDE